MPSAPTTAPFSRFIDGPLQREPLRTAITAAYRRPETEAVPALLEQARLPAVLAQASQALAQSIAQRLRERKNDSGRAGIVQGLLQEYALSSQEGVALMCLAEALLRIPDSATRNALIRDKISHGNWGPHLGRSPSLFVNAASWGLLLTGKLVSTHSEAGLTSTLGGLIRKGGEPLIRKGVDMAMRMMGEQFVTGETIELALAHAKGLEAQGFRYSYDMLGEAALTAEDAQRYLAAYEAAIHAIGQAAAGKGIYDGAGISIKLSALHPRYSRAQYQRVMDELYPTLLHLAMLAKRYQIGLNIDAEEADRLELSLDLLERLCFAPELAGFNGIGFVIQAYQKRCPAVIDFVIDLARRSQHRLMIRLVKGAYWDSEIKRAQLDGQDGYPVYTRKAYTDVSYLACARKLLAAPEAVYPQFATHNAHTLSAIYQLAGPDTYQPGLYEFQCLHGMGEPLYEQVVGDAAHGKLGRPCRIYAPVGTHETLLAYLVRRLLENGANTSFVNRVADPTIAIDTLVEDPVATVDRMAREEGICGLPHPAIALPCKLYGTQRRNSAGLDLSNENQLAELNAVAHQTATQTWTAEPMLAVDNPAGLSAQNVLNPSDQRDVVGTVREASAAEVNSALVQAQAGGRAWAATPPSERAALLDRTADLMQEQTQALIGLLIREAGKTAANAIAEVREAIDFLRYYAAQVRADFDNSTHVPLGPVVCISPWNFPLAIFTGQVAAALAAGNTVLAKPAEQTPLVAAQAVRLLWQAGVPRTAVQLLPGQGETVGAQLVGDARVQGVMFTGSTEVARLLQRTLAQRLSPVGKPIPLIAETGGQNAMIVDSSALTEQVVNDVVSSAFDSAGQRCSALRVLCVQEDVADRVIAMLKGAMAEQRLGNPDALAVDIGPVIDAAARDNIEHHIADMRAKGRQVYQQARQADGASAHGTFVLPTLIELEHISELQREIFGPVLHLVRFDRRELGALIEQINATGYGLTLGVHTRIDETIAQVVNHAHVGNLYVNRNMVGAVVGVQPFGGEGLSGTGPKAGGPLYLYRLLAQRPSDCQVRAVAFSGMVDEVSTPPALLALQQWAQGHGHSTLASACQRFAQDSRSGATCTLNGPTGERNLYSLHPRDAVLCLAEREEDRLLQLAAALAVGSRAVWPSSTANLRNSLPAAIRECIALAEQWQTPAVAFDAVLHHGNVASLREVCGILAQRPGPIVGVQGLDAGDTDVALEKLVIERSLSVNTAAAGGNASLMTLA
jgi:RHH-type transcriptional regulator, proline utilization regulon repressor / proline dehydrogenase / delta 1-pyrroline-5-carboxylate dehydrogenase